MTRIYILIIATGLSFLSAQTIPDLPVASGAGAAITWNDSIYYFGGSRDWNGFDLSPAVYKYDGSSWTFLDSMPDDKVWDLKAVLAEETVYLLSGWQAGAELIRKYDLRTGDWTYLNPSPNNRTWGCTAEYVNGKIYLFNPLVGDVYEYDILSDSWLTKTRSSINARFGMSSTVYDGEIYLAGFTERQFHKYNPATDTWTRLADTPSTVIAAGLGLLDEKIICIGGGIDEEPTDPSDSVFVYDVAADIWTIDQFEIADRRQWMADVVYQGDLYVIGGFDSLWTAQASVAKITPLGPAVKIDDTIAHPAEFSLAQNYPNPFNPTTTIRYTLPFASDVNLGIFNLLGQRVRLAVLSKQETGAHTFVWDGRNDAGNAMPSGAYFYRLRAGDVVMTRQMLLLR